MQGKCFYYFVSLVCSKIFIGQQCVKRARYRFSPLPTIRFLILRIILFSSWFVRICLKLGQYLNFKKDRKRIKTSEKWEVKIIVELVNLHCITVFRCKTCTLLATNNHNSNNVQYFLSANT